MLGHHQVSAWVSVGYLKYRHQYVFLETKTHLFIVVDCTTHSFTVDFWEQIAWSDETPLQLYRVDGSLRFGDNLMLLLTLHGECEDPVMVWGAGSWCYMGSLILIKKIVTGNGLISILSEHLHLLMSIAHSMEFQVIFPLYPNGN